MRICYEKKSLIWPATQVREGVQITLHYPCVVPRVARAVLQTPLSLIHQSLILFLPCPGFNPLIPF